MKKRNYREDLALVLVVSSLVAGLACCIWVISFTLANPDMTGLQLLIKNSGPAIGIASSVINCLIGFKLLKK